jgi:hypothetical protein
MKPCFFLAFALLLAPAGKAQMRNELVDEERNEAKAEEKAADSKKNVVKLYTRKEKGTVIVTSHRPQEVKIYVFDLDGTMMYQSMLKKNEKKKIDSLEKGTYTYIIFDRDESVEEGKLIIK